MFGLLKNKLSKAIESISKKFEKKEQKEEPIEKPVEAPVEVPIEKPAEEKPVEEPIVEEVPAVEQLPEVTEVKEEIREEVVPGAVEAPEEVIERPEEILPEPKVEIPVEEKVEERFVEKKVEKPVETPEVKPEKKGFFKRIAERIVKKVTEVKLSEQEISPVLDELATDLIEADVAVSVAEKIKDDLKKSLVDKEIKRGKEKESIIEALRSSLTGILYVPQVDLEKMVEKKPVVLLFLGFNGSGKTTSLAKCAYWLKQRGYSSVFAAADTFRAASIEQLEEHANRLGLKVVKHKYGADPAAVIFDAIEHAKATGINFVLADTAGRAHTNKDLMEQMKKIIRVNKPDLKILVIDSLTGNDAVLQARAFGEVGVDAVIFTKVDVNEKGGAILSVTHELKKPILFISLGQEYEKFEMFDSKKFVDNLLG